MNSYRFQDIAVGLTAEHAHTVTEGEMEAFSALSGDVNPLHGDDDFARRRGYPGRVVFGMQSASLISALAGVYLPGEHCILHEVSVSFVRPVFPGDTLTAKGTVTEVDDRFRQMTVKVAIVNQKGEKVCRGSYRAGTTE